MKVLCLRYPRNTVTDILISLLCIFIISLILINADYRKDIIVVNTTDAAKRFFENNGWVADIDSCVLSEKTIPIFFDETFEQYAALQKMQGFELEKYKGKKVTVLSYPLMNYAEHEDCGNIYINLLMFDGEVIGADILCTAIDGFITGAVRDVNNQA